jgi:transposase
LVKALWDSNRCPGINGYLLDQSLRSFGEVLEQYGFEIRVVNARHVKHVPGRTKTDVLDCQWIQKLHSFGLLNGSLRPDQEIRKLRTYMRLRDNLVVASTQAVHHMQKALFEK